MLSIHETGVPRWAEVSTPELAAKGLRILVQIDERDGRWVVVDLVLMGDVVDSTALKSVPIARIESTLNSSGVGHALSAHDVGLRIATETSRAAIELLLQPAPGVQQAADGLSAFKESRPPSFPPSRKEPREPLVRPDGSDSEGFYRRVAKTYAVVVTETSSPAKVIAEEAGVPVPTVHRWIHEARRRGFLPPARKGRAG